jgi:hypothetical protein
MYENSKIHLDTSLKYIEIAKGLNMKPVLHKIQEYKRK